MTSSEHTHSKSDETKSLAKLYEIESFQVDLDGDLCDLVEKWDAVDLAMILSYTFMTGEGASHLRHRFWLTIEGEQEWKEIVQWLDQHLDEYDIGFTPCDSSTELADTKQGEPFRLVKTKPNPAAVRIPWNRISITPNHNNDVK